MKSLWQTTDKLKKRECKSKNREIGTDSLVNNFVDHTPGQVNPLKMIKQLSKESYENKYKN